MQKANAFAMLNAPKIELYNSISHDATIVRYRDIRHAPRFVAGVSKVGDGSVVKGEKDNK